MRLRPGLMKSKECCSRLCGDVEKSIFNSRQEYVRNKVVECKNCGEYRVYPASKSSGRKYCSNECAREDRDYDCFEKQGEIRECPECSEEFYVYPHSKDRRTFCSFECRGKRDSREVRGENHPNWKGVSDWADMINVSEEKRQKVYKRDNYECWFCDVSQEAHKMIDGKRLHLHHVVPRRIVAEKADSLQEADREANKMSNLITVCNICHTEKATGV
jgi:hypothetical protein